MAIVDVMNYLVAPQAWASSYHLDSSTPGGNPTYSLWDITTGWWYQMKSGQGWPWDINYVGRDNVYQVVTELDWNSPSNYKTFASASWQNSKGGIAWCPRFIDDANDFVLPLVTPDSSYYQCLNCVRQAKQNVGQVTCTVMGPKAVALGGDLGTQPCLIQTYQRSGSLEVNYYALGYGHVWWRNFDLQAGVYKKTAENLTNLIGAGGAPAPVFPCGLP